MKKLLIFLCMLLSMTIAQPQIQRSGRMFVETRQETKSEPVKTNYQYTDSKGKVYPIYLLKNGRAFVYKTSAKTGKQYKYYLPKEVGKSICSELGIKYIETKTK